MNIRLYNTLTKRIDSFTPLDPGCVRMYSCGPTVYDVAHIGNMRAFLMPDLLARTLRVVGGYELKWVMNITDIDDKTIRDSAVGSQRWLAEMGEQGNDPHANLKALTSFYTKEFHRDLEVFGIRQEHFTAQPLATDFIPQMQSLILSIISAGFGYVSEGSVYFSVGAYSKQFSYGRLFAIDKEHFREGVRIDADEYDRDSVSDFVLWKGHKDGEPFWDFEIDGVNYPGRPGWHIECSAMSKEILGLPFDIHTGGVDLRFPHHEDELAQCTAGYHQHNQATFWIHNEFLEVEGRKMSKSLGNFFTLRDLMNQGLDPLDIRFAMLQAHYRTVFNFTFDGVRAASVARGKLQEYVYQVKGLLAVSDDSASPIDDPKSALLREQFFSELANDLHTPKALAVLFAFIAANPALLLTPQQAHATLEVLSKVNEVLAVLDFGHRPAVVVPEVVETLARNRWNARTNNDWALSDKLRAELNALGWNMNDGKETYTIEQL